MPEKTVRYFAYGSNLDKRQIQQRLGRVPPSTVACLPHYRVAFNKRGSALGETYANIVEDPDGQVWGVVYELTASEVEILDQCEGLPGGHYRRGCVEVIARSGETIQAETYFAGENFLCAEGQPSVEYLEKILAGARAHRLPEDYIRGLEQLAER